MSDIETLQKTLTEIAKLTRSTPVVGRPGHKEEWFCSVSYNAVTVEFYGSSVLTAAIAVRSDVIERLKDDAANAAGKVRRFNALLETIEVDDS